MLGVVPGCDAHRPLILFPPRAAAGRVGLKPDPRATVGGPRPALRRSFALRIPTHCRARRQAGAGAVWSAVRPLVLVPATCYRSRGSLEHELTCLAFASPPIPAKHGDGSAEVTAAVSLMIVSLTAASLVCLVSLVCSSFARPQWSIAAG